MRVLLFFSFILSVFLLSPGVLEAQSDSKPLFASNLAIGSTGQDVLVLQQILNEDPATRVSEAGLGSPGNETSYFGELTRTAVVRFQEKYSTEILVPANLAKGNGYVGAFTRAKLIALLEHGSAVAPDPAAPMTTPLSAVPAALSPTTPPAANTPENTENLDLVLAAIDNAGAAQGLTAAAISKARDAAREQLATSTDMVALFLAKASGLRNAVSVEPQSENIFTRATAIALALLSPARAHAAATGVPFGALLKSVIACNGGVFNLYFSPLPPSYAVTLSYVSGSQAFLSYNIPFTPALLGFYEPGPGSCVVGNVPVPSEGIITPQVGSAPL